MAKVAIPSSAGPVVAIAGRNGRYMGFRMNFSAAGTVRLWSGPVAAPVAPTGAPVNQGPLDEVVAGAAGNVDFAIPGGPMDGEQYINGIYVELVSGTMPTGDLIVRGPLNSPVEE